MPTQVNLDRHNYDPVNILVSISSCSEVAVDMCILKHILHSIGFDCNECKLTCITDLDNCLLLRQKAAYHCFSQWLKCKVRGGGRLHSGVGP